MSEPATPNEYERKRRELEQLKASKSEMAAAIGAHIDWLLEMEAGGMLRSAEDMEREPFGIAEASARAREPRTYEPGVDRRTGKFEPEQVSWFELGNLMEHEPEKGRDLWQAIKAAARQEFGTGVRGATALEGPMHQRRLWQRAQFLAIIDALGTDLKPRGGLEWLMIQRMAATYELCLRWQRLAVERQEFEEWQGESTMRQEHANMSPQQKERHRWQHGYLPPRLSQAEAIQEAALMADRNERAFLRLVREFRNQRRMFASLIVAEGGTVNVSDGPQQVNIDARTKAKSRHKE
jgi:hypothetical protein